MSIQKIASISGIIIGLLLSFWLGRITGSKMFDLKKKLDNAASSDVYISLKTQREIINSHRDLIDSLSNRIAQETNPHTLAIFINLLYEISTKDAIRVTKAKINFDPNTKKDLEARLSVDLLDRMKEKP